MKDQLARNVAIEAKGETAQVRNALKALCHTLGISFSNPHMFSTDIQIDASTYFDGGDESKRPVTRAQMNHVIAMIDLLAEHLGVEINRKPAQVSKLVLEKLPKKAKE